MRGLGLRRGGAVALGIAAIAIGAKTIACTPGRLDALDSVPDSLTVGMMAHYTFDETSGTTVADHSGNHRDGVVSGVTDRTWIGDGEFGGAIHLDGDSFATVDPFPDAPPSFSVSAWVRTTNTPPDAGLQTVVSTEIGLDAGWEINVDKTVDGGGLQAAYWDSVLDTYTFAECLCIPDATWTHFAFVVDDPSHTLTIYVNGRPNQTVPAPRPIIPGNPALSIGHWLLPGRLLVGDIDDVVVYARALSGDEVLRLFAGPPPDPGP
jgi:hypothetical protein